MDHSSSDSSDSMTMMMMTPYLHFSGGDNLFFKDIAPGSKGAIAGAAIILFFLAAFERYIVAMRSVMEARWGERARALVQSQVYLQNNHSADVIKTSQASLPPPSVSRRRIIPPFIWSHDISRGAMHTLQSFLHFALMLAVMTFQAAYIITIIAGLGVGEIVFGRLSVLTMGAQSH
ncbi:hypothetical protein ACEPAI_808 [Sanghuangporus weigelae]